MDKNNLIKYRCYFGCSFKRGWKKKKEKKKRKKEEEAKSWIRNLFFDELENARYLREIARAIIIIVSVLKLKWARVKRENFFFLFLHNKNIKISYRTDLSIPFKRIVEHWSAINETRAKIYGYWYALQ